MWIFLSVASAFLDATKYLLGKKAAARLSITTVSWGQWFFGLIFLIPLFFTARNFLPPSIFWGILVIDGVLNTLAILLFWYGLRQAELSLVIPITNFIPVFSLLLSPFVNKEYPGFAGIIGVCVTAVGAYLLQLNKQTSTAHITQMYAITMAQVPYVLALKSTTVLFSVIFGKLFYQEKNIRQRFVAAFIMGLGATLIIFFG